MKNICLPGFRCTLKTSADRNHGAFGQHMKAAKSGLTHLLRLHIFRKKVTQLVRIHIWRKKKTRILVLTQ